jgi:putative tricarboxylic transport membrane protein
MMETLAFLTSGFAVALQPINLLMAAIGAFIGTVVGLLPGLGPINGVAILMPLAFAMKLPPETALILLAAVYIGCEYGGRISSILLNVPGDAAAIMTAMDGYPMARKGMGGVALSISAWSSFVGSIIATIGIVMLTPLLSRWALAFGPAEYFALMVFAFACLTGLLGDQPVKALLATLIGLSLATVGVDANSGVYRFTFDSINLSDGIQFIVVVIGLFSISELLLMLEESVQGKSPIPQTGRTLFNLREMAYTWWSTVRSSLVGFVVGILPGAGATVASAITYSMEKRIAGRSGTFGEGDIRGVAAPEAANNAAANASFIPMVGLFTRMLKVPSWALVPGILAVSAVGVYAVHATTFDLILMSILGLVGYALRKCDMPMAPLILGFVLGELMEQNLRRALSITNGELGILWESPISIGLWICAALMVIVPLAARRFGKPLDGLMPTAAPVEQA